MNGFEIAGTALGAAVVGGAVVALARAVLGRYVARALRRQYPLLPLTASLAAHGWMLASAIITHAGYEAAFEESDEERRQAVEDAFKLGWAGARLDDLLDSWIGEGWGVMATVCRRSHRLDGGGLTEVQARLMLRRLQEGRDAATLGRDESGFAEALARAAFHAAVPDRVADAIRREAAPLCRDRAASRVSLRERALRVFRRQP